MGITRLVRKAKKNRTVSRQRVNSIKRLTSKPVIKNVDIEQIKAEFANRKAKLAVKKEAPKAEAPKAEVSATENKEVKKAAPKNETPKAKEVSEKKSTKKEDKAAE